jgi:hypothetical protein
MCTRVRIIVHLRQSQSVGEEYNFGQPLFLFCDLHRDKHQCPDLTSSPWRTCTPQRQRPPQRPPLQPTQPWPTLTMSEIAKGDLVETHHLVLVERGLARTGVEVTKPATARSLGVVVWCLSAVLIHSAAASLPFDTAGQMRTAIRTGTSQYHHHHHQPTYPRSRQRTTAR